LFLFLAFLGYLIIQIFKSSFLILLACNA
jgi:hypothetical protein